MAHQLRALQHVLDAQSRLTWARALRKLFQPAIEVHHQRSQMTFEQFERQVTQIERNCDRLLHQDLAPPAAQKLQRRYLIYRSCLFVFFHRTDVEPTNKVAERALRHSVVNRKVTNGFRSVCGTNTYAALALVIDTAELPGIRAFDTIQSLIDPPVLPIAIGCEYLHYSSVSFQDILALLPAPIALMVLIYADEILTARVFAAKHGQKMDANQEFIAIDMTNIGAGFLTGFPAALSASRTRWAENPSGLGFLPPHSPLPSCSF
jgi:hypothetical protein